MKKLISLFLVMALILGVLAGCGAKEPVAETPAEPAATDAPEAAPEATDAPEAAEPAESETALKLAWFQSGGIDTLFENPHKDTVSMYPKAIFEPLAAYDNAAGEMVWMLATEGGSNADCTEWWFTIREGVKWHDGEDFTTDDVVFSILSAAVNPNANKAYDFNYVVGYEAFVNGEADTMEGIVVDGNKVTIKLTQPVSTFDQEAFCLYILPEHLLSDSALADVDTDDFWKSPIGTGPYMVNEVAMPDYFTATRFDGYWGEPAGIKNLMFTSYQAGGSDAAVAAMITGDLDFLQYQLLTDVTAANNMAAQNADLGILSEDSYSVRFMAFNVDQRTDGNNKAAMKDANARKAISLLVDEATIQSFYPNQAVDTKTMVPTKDAFYADVAGDASFDAETAKQLLTEAGWNFDDTFQIAYYYDDQTTKDIMAMIEQNFAQAGVKCETILLSGDLTDLIYGNPNYDLIYLAGGGWAASPAQVYLNTGTTNGAYTFIGDNDTRAARYNELWDKYVSALKLEDRKAYAIELQKLGAEDYYAFPLFTKNQIESYNTTHVELPLDVFAMSDAYDLKWSEWKILY